MGERHYIISTSQFPVVHVKENSPIPWSGYGYTDWKPLASLAELGIGGNAFADFWRRIEGFEPSKPNDRQPVFEDDFLGRKLRLYPGALYLFRNGEAYGDLDHCYEDRQHLDENLAFLRRFMEACGEGVICVAKAYDDDLYVYGEKAKKPQEGYEEFKITVIKGKPHIDGLQKVESKETVEPPEELASKLEQIKNVLEEPKAGSEAILNTGEQAMAKKWMVHLKPFPVEASNWDEAFQKARERLKTSEPEIAEIIEEKPETPKPEKPKPQPAPTAREAARKAWIKIWLKRGDRAKAEERAKELGIDLSEVEKEL